MPIETIRPVTPARSKLGATEVWPSAEMIDQSSAPVTPSPTSDDEPEEAVVEDDVEHDEGEPGEAGAEARDEGGVAEGRRRLTPT